MNKNLEIKLHPEFLLMQKKYNNLRANLNQKKETIRTLKKTILDKDKVIINMDQTIKTKEKAIGIVVKDLELAWAELRQHETDIATYKEQIDFQEQEIKCLERQLLMEQEMKDTPTISLPEPTIDVTEITQDPPPINIPLSKRRKLNPRRRKQRVEQVNDNTNGQVVQQNADSPEHALADQLAGVMFEE